MAGETEFDLESFRQLPPDAQTAAQDAIGAMEQISQAGMALGDANFDQWRAMSDYAGQASRALTGLDVATSITEGRYEDAVETAGEWLTGEALSNGFSEAIQQTTRENFAREFGWRPGAQDVHGAWADAVGGAMADAAMAASQGVQDVGEFIRDQATRPDTRQVPQTQFEQTQAEYNYNAAVQQFGGVQEYSHFNELPYEFALKNEDTMARQAVRPESYGFHLDIAEATRQAANTIANGGVSADYDFHLTPPFVTRDPAIDSLSDFIQVEGDSRYAGEADSLRFDLSVADRLGTNLRADVGDYARAYAADAEYEDGRDFGGSPGEIYADIRNVVEGSESFLLELRDMQTEFPSDQAREQYFESNLFNHNFTGGYLDGTSSSGAILVGRDDGHHRGSDESDLSLDGSNVVLAGGDDIAILDNETGRSADGGAGNDTIIGGNAGETIHGGTGQDHLRAGAGNDIVYSTGPGLPDDRVEDRLAGGPGDDYIVAGHNDIVEASPDGHDRGDTLVFNQLEIRGPVSNEANIPTGISGETYTLGPDGTTLSIHHQGNILHVEDFSEGDFGIELSRYDREEAMLGPERLSLPDAMDRLDIASAELRVIDPGLTTPTNWMLNHPGSQDLFRTLAENDIQTLDVNIDDSMTAEATASSILVAGQRALVENELELPTTEAQLNFEAEHPAPNVNQSVADLQIEQINSYEPEMEDDYSYAV